MVSIGSPTAWELLPQDPLAEAALRERFGFGAPLARTLVARGYKDPDAVARFLDPSLERDWLDPEHLPGIPEAADRVASAVRGGESICVFGDFDVDGMTATSLLTLGLRELGGRVAPFIPRRFSEGYGMSEAALERAKALARPSLVITVDTGIASGAEVAGLLAEGIDVVVTDHHEPGDAVPRGVPLVDPKLASGPGTHDLAGAGVALKLLQAVASRFGEADLWRRYLDLAALGTVSDLMPLVDENRALVTAGIELMRTAPRASIETLCAAANRDVRAIEADDLPFCVVPRLNAPGRMGDADVSLELLLTEDPARAQVLAAAVEDLNNARKEAERELSEEALAMAELTYVEGDRSIVLGGEGWHEGVKGVCATRLVAAYGVPVLLFSVHDGIARGSGRSVGSVDLYHAVERVSDATLQFGGHAGAVGVTVAAERLAEFRMRLEAVLEELPAERFVSAEPLDAKLRLSDLSLDDIRELDRLKPFGKENPSPVFCTEKVWLTDRQAVGREGTHLRFWVSDGERSLGGIRFREPDMARALAWDGPVELIYRPVAETWQGRTRAKLRVEEILYPASADRLLGSVRAPEAATEEGSAVRSALTGLSEEGLTRELARALIGDHELLPAQAKAFASLARGASTFCVMATGRGKSLIFQLHALREAISRRRATVIVYPLRALVSDQASAMGDAFSSLGVGVATLTGESDEQARRRIYADLARGAVDVLLTTPEYLALHARDVARCGRVGFLVVDEAHHAGESKGGNRSAYQELPSIRALLGEPVCLGVTATARTEVAAEAMRLLGATELVVDDAVRENLLLVDDRDDPDRDDHVAEVVGSGDRTIVYVSSRTGAATLTRELRHRLPRMGQRIAHYHAGLTREERTRVEGAFREGVVSAIVATSAFGEGINLPDVRHVALYHLPYDVTAFNQMSGRAGRDGAEAWVHLAFGEEDAEVNERVLARNAPTREALVALWNALRAVRAQVGPRFQEVDSVLAAAARECSGLDVFPEAMVAPGIRIFEELGFLATGFSGGAPVIALAEKPANAPLEGSVRYLEGQRTLAAFDDFRRWVLRASTGELRDRIIRPITPVAP